MHFPCTAVPVECCPYLTDASHSISDTIRNPCVSCPLHHISLTRLPFTILHGSCPSHYSCGLGYALPQQFSATLIHCKTFELTTFPEHLESASLSAARTLSAPFRHHTLRLFSQPFCSNTVPHISGPDITDTVRFTCHLHPSIASPISHCTAFPQPFTYRLFLTEASPAPSSHVFATTFRH